MILPWIESALGQFRQQRATGRQPHAILLTGAEGLGRDQLANSLAADLLCLHGGEQACGECRSCQLLAGGAHPDFRWISFIPRKNSEVLRTEIIIDQVRELIASMQLTRSISPRKVAIITPADALNRAAANALLKTLEEPLGEVTLLLVARDAGRLPATIRSRCQLLALRQPSREEALQWLRQQSEAEGDLLELALEAAGGGPLLALQSLQDGSLGQYQQIVDLLQHATRGESALAETVNAFSQMEPLQLWSGLATSLARRVRTGYAADSPPGQADRWLRLYSLAVRNRRLASTPVRQDLLLRDWLIQWKQLGDAEASAGR